MSNTFVIPKKEYKTSIRTVDFGNLTVGGGNSLPFMNSESAVSSKQLVAVEILTNLPQNYPGILSKAWGNCINDPVEWAGVASKSGADLLAVRFNIADCENIDAEIAKSRNQLVQILNSTNIPVIILGAGRKDVDVKLIPALAGAATRKCTVGVVEEDTYKDIIPAIKEFEHNVIARTPIDISLAKELNILITELGYNPDKIIIDPNMGALGYGIDYAYSVIERIRLAALEGDTMLNMPIIALAGIEAWKSKEAKSENVPEEWGNIKARAIAWECLTVSSILTAGADLVVVWHPEIVKYIKNFIASAGQGENK